MKILPFKFYVFQSEIFKEKPTLKYKRCSVLTMEDKTKPIRIIDN